jgi:hypothetical protein
MGQVSPPPPSESSATNKYPLAPDTIKSLRVSHSPPKSTSVPLPAGIELPENENPSTVLFPVDVENPAAAAAPPEAPITVTPFTAN